MTSPETGCPHEFSPRPQDLERLTQTKVLAENGLNLEVYPDRALRAAPPDIFITDASSGVPALMSSSGRVNVPGDPSSSGALEPSPRIFLSPENAALMTANIARSLTEKDTAGSEHCKDRLERFRTAIAAPEQDTEAFKKTHSGCKAVTSHGFMDCLLQETGLVIIADIEAVPDVAPSPARLQGISRIIRHGPRPEVFLHRAHKTEPCEQGAAQDK